jgi:hypothetical protein
MATRMQQRRGTATQWTTANPVLNAAEIGWESDTNKFKIGDGTNNWANLTYFVDATDVIAASLGAYLQDSDVGAISGVAGLDASKNLVVPGASIHIEGATDNTNETTLTVVDPTADRTITFPDATGTVAILDATQTFTNKTLTSPKINEDVAVTATATELNYVDGVTSAIQTQIDAKAPLASPALTGTATAVNLTISGNLTVDGTTTNINSTNLVVEDKNIVLGDTGTPTDTTADGGGLTLKGLTDKTFNWVDATDAWTSSEHINLASGKAIYLNGTLETATAQTLTNKTVALGSNTVSGTLAQFNTAVTDADFASLAGSETLTNKTLTSPVLTLSTSTSTTDAVLAWDTTNKKIAVGNGTDALDFATSTLPINAQVASYTLVLADKDKIVEMSNASANTLTVPLNATVAYPVGTQINIIQTGAGQTTVAATGGVTINSTPGLKIRAQWSSATLIKRATNTWVLVGDLSA